MLIINKIIDVYWRGRWSRYLKRRMYIWRRWGINWGKAVRRWCLRCVRGKVCWRLAICCVLCMIGPNECIDGKKCLFSIHIHIYIYLCLYIIQYKYPYITNTLIFAQSQSPACKHNNNSQAPKSCTT